MNDIEIAKSKALLWLSAGLDEATNHSVKAILEDESELREAFLNDLDFGTGGLRGIMGTGTSRINQYTIGMATQGLANYLIAQFPGEKLRAAIAFDSRNNSPALAHAAARVLSAAGITVYLFDEMRPTPLLSYTVRYLNCHAGIVVTASHNPPAYNGYKVYWQDGAQVTPPHDKGIIDEVRRIQSPSAVNFKENASLILTPHTDVEESYLVKSLNLLHLEPEQIRNSKLKIVYTSLHGAGITMVPKLLNEAGFDHVELVKEQAKGNGDFPTVKSPNPEEKEALKMALDLAVQTDADIVLGTDPDTDRVGIAVRDHNNNMVLINGNQAGALIAWYELKQWKAKDKLTPNCFIAKTVVTSDLVEAIGRYYGVNVYNTLTGFKYIAELIQQKEGKEKFICGGEESYGYLISDFVRDKDGVISSMVLCELAAYARMNGSSVWEMLMEIYKTFGFYYDELLSITLPGLDGSDRIQKMMSGLRNNPPRKLGNSQVSEVIDFNERTILHLNSGERQSTNLPPSNVMQFVCENGNRITARPSGTEPKIKFYFSLRTSFDSGKVYEQHIAMLQPEIEDIKKQLLG